MGMFNNFDEYLGEESLWQISEKIKPRVIKKRTERIDSSTLGEQKA